MSRKYRPLWIAALAICAVFALLVVTALYALQSHWFKEKVRQKIVLAVEETSGGRVELDSFDYDWRTLTADFRNFVVHGSEPVGGPPLFRATSVRVGLKIVSLLKRDVDIASLVVNRPEIYLLVRADGSTNIPSPKLRRRQTKELVEQLLHLKVRRFDFNHGAIQADLRRIPLSAHGENLNAVVAYNRAGPRYDISLSSHTLHLDSDRFRPFAADLDTKAELQKDRVVIRQLTLAAGTSKVEAAGTLQHFAQPTLDLHSTAQLSAKNFGELAGVNELQDGDLTITGTAHYDRFTPFTVAGKLAGHRLAYRSHSLALKNAEVRSDFTAQPQAIRFTSLDVTAMGAKLTGGAVLRRFRQLQLDGRISGLKLHDAGPFLTDKPFPWNGVANGPVHIEATLNARAENFMVQSELEITPASPGIPVSGNLDASYREPGGVMEVQDSHLHLPDTQLSLSGIVGANLQVVLDSTDLTDLKPALPLFASAQRPMSLPRLLKDGSAHFDGMVAGPLTHPRIEGNLALTHFQTQGPTWDRLRSRVELSTSAIDFSSLVIDQGALHIAADGRIGLNDWSVSPDSAFRVRGQFRGVDIVKTMAEFPAINRAVRLPVVRGTASGSIDAAGSIRDPHGSARIVVDNLAAYGERIDQVELQATASGDQLQIDRGRLQAGPALISFSGTYNHVHGFWREGQADLRVDSNAFPLAGIAPVRRYEPGLNAQSEIHARAAARISSGHIQPTQADGTVVFRNVTVYGVPYGSVTFGALTRGQTLDATFSGDLRESHLRGSAQVQLVPGATAKGELHLDRIDFAVLYALLNSAQKQALPFDGFLQGGLTFEAPLQQLNRLRGTVRIDQVQLSPKIPVETGARIKPADFVFRNLSPIVLDASNGVAIIRSFQLGAKDTNVRFTGSVPYLQQLPMNLKVDGAVDLTIFQLFDPNVQSSGQSRIDASITGTVTDPSVNGTLNLNNGSFFLKNVTNGLSAVNGTVRFDHDRATIEKLTAHSGGGELSLGGFVSFGLGGPVVYGLQANANDVRVRYAGGISVTGTSTLRLTGTSESSLLSGTVTVSRAVFNPNTDLGNLLASVSAPVASPSNEKDFLTGLLLDVRIESAPNLQLSTALSQDVEAGIDLRLRGTPDRPVLLGSVSANQGDIKVFGTKYSINRGEVSFVNPVKIEPVLDLDLQTEARGITVDITVSGTLSKLNINYRSDPPLQPRDIIALLTVGRAPNSTLNSPNMPVTNDVSALQSGANTVLGQAISPVSNRLSKLFGITNIKIDPLVQGITNTPQARLTLEQQISRDISVTYVTNLSQTSEQIFRLEWALSRQYSIVALRDDNGEFGIDIQYKKRFK